MKDVKTILDAIKRSKTEKRAIDNNFKEDLEEIIAEKYNGDFIRFMNEYLFIDEYLSIRFDVESLCGKPLF